MVKTKFKKAVSPMLAAVTNLTAFMGIGATTAFAAVSEKADVYLVDCPRSGDTNNNGEWGHGNLNYMNGWKDSSTKRTGFRVMDSYSSNITYCIEPGTGQRTEDTLTEKDENFFNNISPNGMISGDDIRLLISHILQYGYHGGISTSWKPQNESDVNCIAHAYATQILIWETIVGERDASFSHVSTGGYNVVLGCVNSAYPLRSKILSYYSSMVTSVQNHTKVLSFCTRSSGSAKVNEPEWNGSKYVATLTDINGALGNYNFSANIDGVSFSVSGNKLTVSMGKVPSKESTITVAKKNGVRGGAVVRFDGIYQNGSGVQDVVTYAQEASDPVSGFVKMKVSYDSCQIVKTSEDGKVDDIQFIISGNGADQTVTTTNGGKFQPDNPMPDVYTVTEQSIDKYVPQEVHGVTVAVGQVAKVNFDNVLKRGNLQVIKSSEDNLVEGVTFHLYGILLTGIVVDEYAVADKNGVASFDDMPISGTIPYTTEEVGTAIRYVVPTNQTVPINWKEATTRNLTNVLKKLSVTIAKSDREGGTPQGNATPAGAVYGIYKGETFVDKHVTDKNGQFTTKEYICDNDWAIREVMPSEDYLLDGIIHKAGAEPQLYTVEHNQTANDITEQVMKGNIAIIKHTDDGGTRIETPESGVTFEIYLKSSDSFNSAEEDEKGAIVCDENGFGQTKGMPYGVYTAHQTAGWEGRELMRDFDVFISQNGQTCRYLINNTNPENYTKVAKVDVESGKNTPYAGAGLKIFDSDGNQVTMALTYPTPTTTDTSYTDANGQLVTPEKLEYGKGYPPVEVQTPYGYVPDSAPVYFDVAEEHFSNEGGITVIKVDKPNMVQKGIVSIEKTGEVFSGVNISGEENADVIYQSAYEMKGLAGVVYKITAAGDIITPDGILRYAKGEAVDTVTADENGLTKSKELYLGKYTVVEITAPEGMAIDKEAHEVELTYVDQEASVTETVTSFANDRRKVTVSLGKTIEKNDIFNIGNGDEMKNISFGFLAAEELASASGTSIPADGLIETISLSENGKAVIKTKIPFGSYYVKELTIDEYYILSDAKYPFTLNYAGQDTANVETAVNNGKAIENKLIYGSISGRKITENGEALGGAVIGPFKTDEIELTKGNALMTATSENDGSFSFDKVSCGNWLVKEIEQPEGFAPDETSHEVKISEVGQIIEAETVNEYVHGNIKLTKVDEDYPDNKLTGAISEIYKDVNGDGKPDDGDELIGTLNETSTGIYEMKGLLYGKYLVRETKAPEGFELDKGVYFAFIEKDETTYEIENKADVGFINTAMKGNLKIVKTSSDKKVEGLISRVTGANGYGRTFMTNKNGEIIIEGLRIGDYTIPEVQDSVSASYMLPADKIATAKVGSTTAVEMYSELRDISKTGDNSNIGLRTALAGLSALGIVGTVAVAYRRKKKEDNE